MNQLIDRWLIDRKLRGESRDPLWTNGREATVIVHNSFAVVLFFGASFIIKLSIKAPTVILRKEVLYEWRTCCVQSVDMQ